jgi:hypothetical protein
MKNKTLEFFVGVVIGLITPFIAAEILRATLFSYITYENIENFTIHIYMPVIKLGAFANMIPFLIFNKLEWESAMKGMVTITLIFAFTILGIIYL